MRISDWSSDVCASDLGGEVDGGRAQRPRHADAAVAVLNLDFAQVACVEKFGKLPDQIGIDLHGCALGRGIGHLNPCFTYDSRSSPVCAHPCPMRTAASSRSEERRVGRECVRTWRTRWLPCHLENNTIIHKTVNQETKT